MASRYFFDGPQTLVPSTVELFGVFTAGSPVTGNDLPLERLAGTGFRLIVGPLSQGPGVLIVELEDQYTEMVPAQGTIGPLQFLWADVQAIRPAGDDYTPFALRAFNGGALPALPKRPAVLIFHPVSPTTPGPLGAGDIYMVRIVLGNSTASLMGGA